MGDPFLEGCRAKPLRFNSDGNQHPDPGGLAPLSGLADDNLDFLVQRIEEAEQPVRRESLQSAPEKGGNPRLVCAQDTCGLLLGELALLDEFADAIGNLRFDVEFLSVRQLQVLEDVLPALTDGFVSFHGVCFLCFSTHCR